MNHSPYSHFAVSTSFDADQQAITEPKPNFAMRALASTLWLLGLPGRVAAMRREMTRLGGMEDRELADIGLSRQDLRDASGLRFGESPDAFFQGRAAERRRPR